MTSPAFSLSPDPCIADGDFPTFPRGKTGVLIVNLGTPDAPDAKSVKRYLKEFLSDRRVVEIPPLIWQPILRGIILNIRPAKSARAYAKIWTDQGSPLAVHTAATAKALAERLSPQNIIVDWAMRYGQPSIADRLSALKDAGCDRVLFAPLYPQYSGATTASANDALFAALSAMRWQPSVRILAPYYDEPAYIAALASSFQRHLAAMEKAPDALLISFHGMPERTAQLGDPYYRQCMHTAHLLSAALRSIFTGPIEIGFQSRFGRAKWLSPSVEDKLSDMAARGLRQVIVITPGFSADCIETLEEIAIEGDRFFQKKGGEKLHYFPCLNTDSKAILFYEGLIRQDLAGWI